VPAEIAARTTLAKGRDGAAAFPHETRACPGFAS